LNIEGEAFDDDESFTRALRVLETPLTIPHPHRS
jgi:hypothetical protein